MQHPGGDTSIEESRQSASPVTGKSKQIHFLPRGEIHDRWHDRTEKHMHARQYPLSLQAPSKLFKIRPGNLEFSVDLLLFERRYVVPEVHRDWNRFDNLEKDNLRLAIPVSEIFDVQQDLFRTL